MIPEIRIESYNYPLPDERIAKYPLSQRDASKLLCYKSGNITENRFTDISELLPPDHLMVFNDTKVVPARLHFQRPTGAHIEIFCLEPILPEEYVSMLSEDSIVPKAKLEKIIADRMAAQKQMAAQQQMMPAETMPQQMPVQEETMPMEMMPQQMPEEVMPMEMGGMGFEL